MNRFFYLCSTNILGDLAGGISGETFTPERLVLKMPVFVASWPVSIAGDPMRAIPRASSLVENFNSRLRTYFFFATY
jgi:hypothetical protein